MSRSLQIELCLRPLAKKLFRMQDCERELAQHGQGNAWPKTVADGGRIDILRMTRENHRPSP